MDYSFGNWVKRRRKALDLAQHELAKKVGCSLATIVKIEADERRPSRQIAELLLQHLEVPSDQSALFLKVARQQKGTGGLDAIPPLATPNQPPASNPFQSRIPIAPTPLIGREHETNMVVQQLMNPACRMLTLTGPGGVGKTRLAIEVAHQMETQFLDGVLFLSMAGISLPESLIPAIADMLGIVFSGPVDPKLQIIHHLHQKEILFVMDNFEHLLAGGGLLSDILQQAPKVKILVTSRERVHLLSEWVFEVQGLPIPEEKGSIALEATSATALFLQRARQTSRTFSVNDEDAPVIFRICQFVNGLPLAIELAASWVRVLSCREIMLELERSVDFLATTIQDMPVRHRSIKSVFDHSWKLLSDEEQIVLMSLSIFQGCFTRSASERIAGASLALLSSLVDKSLLRHNNLTDQYDMHELTRQYAVAKLHEHTAEELSTFERYSEYYASWLANLETPLKSAQQIQASALIRAETSNWSTAWKWSVQNRKFGLLRKMIPCLYWYYEVHGYYAEALYTYTSAVDEFRPAGEPLNLSEPTERSTYAFLVDQLGWFEFRTGNVEQAVKLFSESLEIAREQNDPEVLYYIHGNWGYLALLNGDVAEAKRLTSESLANARTLNSQWHIAIPENVLGIVEFQSGNLAEAYRLLTDSLEIWRAVGDPRGLVFCMLYLGSTALALGKADTAAAILSEGNKIASEKMDRWAQAFSLDVLGQAAIFQGAPHESIPLFQKSLALSREIGDQWGSTQTLIHLGDAQASLNIEDARRLFIDAYSNAYQASWTPTILEVLVAFISYDNLILPDTKLSILLAVLSHPSAMPHVRARAEHMRDGLIATLTREQVEEARLQAFKKSPETWAREIIK